MKKHLNHPFIDIMPIQSQVLALLLIFLSFFDFTLLLPAKASIIDYPLFIAIIAITVKYIRIDSIFAKCILVYLAFVFVSCLYSYKFHNQALFMVVAHSYPYLSVIFFFYLLSTRLKAKEAENILITLSLICCICYVVQWLVYPVVLFKGAESHHANSGYYRVRIQGSICCYCLLLYGVNKYLISNKLKYVLYSLLGFFPIIIQGFRTLTSLSAISLFLMIPFVKRDPKKAIGYTILGLFACVLVSQIPIVQSKIAEMEERQNSKQTFSNEDYIRLKEFDYYWNEQFANPVEKLFGGGVPTDPNTIYFKQIMQGAYSKGIFWDDLGLIGLSMIIGAFSVTMLIVIYLIAIWKCKGRNFQYLRFTLFIVLLGSFTTAELFRRGNILILALILYIIYKRQRERKILVKLLRSNLLCHLKNNIFLG